MTTEPAPTPIKRAIAQSDTEERPTFRIGRAAVLSLILAVFFGLVSPLIDFKWGNTPLGSQHTAPGAIGALLLLVLVVNPLLGLLGRRWKLSRDEMLVVYLSCLFSALVAGIGGHNYWPSEIVGAFYYATPGNKWMDFLGALPSWLTPAVDATGHYRAGIVEPFYTGLTPGQYIPWSAWIVPMTVWVSVVFAGLVMTGCLSVILRAQWSDNEALAFPLLRLPLEMTEDADTSPNGSFWRNSLMWIGFGLAASIQLINGLHLYFPDIPEIPMFLETGPLFSEAPWNQMGYTMLQVFPLAIGLSFLLTTEISFSLWFFFWFFKFQYIAAYVLGYSPTTLPSVMPLSTKVFNGYQEVGAYIAIAALTLWTGREHIGYIVRRAFGKAKANDREATEGLSYPVAFWGLLGSFGFLVAWGSISGAHPLVAIWYWGSYLVISLVLSRVLADSGLLFVSKIHDPLTVWRQTFGSGPGTMMGGSHAAANSFLSATGDMRSCLMPSWITSLKLISDRKLPARPLFALFCAVTLITIVLASTTHIRISYESGALSMAAPYTARSAPQGLASAAALFGRGEPVQGGQVVLWTVVGGLMVFGMSLMRSRFAWFPFHPTGFVMAQSWAMHNLWLSVFIGWAAKSLVTRFGGNDAYRKITPLFLGLALGDIAMMLFWLLVDGWQGRTGHVLTP
ncbi:hypothetical protein EON83_11580 [bacterium]|nr:MAG: hypothetical protein EON83_11580 [bacterium]